MKTWDSISHRFHSMSLEASIQPRHIYHAQKMLQLIPKLRLHPELSDLEPGMSLTNLTLESSDTQKTILIWWDQLTNLYILYLYEQTKKINEITASDELVLDNLVDLVKRMRD